MQASKVSVEQITAASRLGWWQSLASVNKLPFAIVFGIFLGLTSPGFDQSWLAWCGLAPLLVLLFVAQSRNEALLCGFCFGFSYHLVALSYYLGLYPLLWMGQDNWVAILIAGLVWILEAAHESLLMVGFSWLVYSLPMRPGFLFHRERPYFPQLLCIPIIWVFFQWLFGSVEPFLGILTDQLAYSQFKQTDLIQIAKLAGPGCVDFLIIMVNVAIASCLFELPTTGQRPVDRVDLLSPRLGALFDLSVAALVVLCVVAWGGFEFHQLETQLAVRAAAKTSVKLPVAILQNNVTIEQEHLKTASPLEIAQLYDDLGRNLSVALMVLPEGAVTATQSQSGHLLDSLKAKAISSKTEIIVGSVEKLGGSLVNGARMIAFDNKEREVYVKRRLFPFLEFIPWRNVLDELPESIKDKIPGSKQTFLRTHITQLLTSVWGKIGVSISTEIIYPRLIAAEVREGASLLVNITNLAYFHNSYLSKQILAAAVFRAVENKRYVILSANTGVSAVIDPAGVVQSATYQGKRGTLLDTVQFLNDRTVFTNMWWL
ncbi:MAG: apolipoprotein N-acyltransferase [Candidatus Melainabacteria bacterium]|nr:MAG: apolipoprotein N-acyltransferase [Candidatus Melainabacteria bacterium]